MENSALHSCNWKKYFIIAAIIASGPALAGYFIGSSVISSKYADRVVTVKGLAEKEVQADFVTWPIKFVATGNTLTEPAAKIEADKKKVISFLKEYGFAEDELEIGAIKVADLLANEYRSGNVADGRFIVEGIIILRSGKIENALKASAQTARMVTSGITLKDSRAPFFSFNGVNAVKKELLTEAIINAKASAEQFAENSGAAIGSIRTANQGVISVSDGYEVDASSGYDPSTNPSTVKKKVRVVATVEYYLK